MNNTSLRTLEKKAGEMALGNIWGEDAYTINMAILEIDRNNTASCTRLGKFYRLKNMITEAKNMYFRALEIDPDSRIAINSLQSIEQDQKEKAAVENIISTKEVVTMGDKSPKKKEEKKKKAEPSAILTTATTAAPTKKAKKTY